LVSDSTPTAPLRVDDGAPGFVVVLGTDVVPSTSLRFGRDDNVLWCVWKTQVLRLCCASLRMTSQGVLVNGFFRWTMKGYLFGLGGVVDFVGAFAAADQSNVEILGCGRAVKLALPRGKREST
jgi:hypothetical protein